VEVPDVSYARSGDVAIAYQVVGDGPQDLVLVSFFANLYTLWLLPRFAAFGRRIAAGRRLVVLNPRGVGLSDRPRGFTVESRMDDVRAVIDDVGSRRPAVLGIGEGAATCALFAASYPDRVERLVLYLPYARGVSDDAKREAELARLSELRDKWGRRDFFEDFARRMNPQWADDPEFIEWFVWHHRLTASPGAWIEFRRMLLDLDVTEVLPAIRVPTLVVSKEFAREEAADVAARIRGAEHVVVPGEGVAIHENDFAAEAIEAFLAGAQQQRIPDTVLSTVLFTDIVGSTERAAVLGDRSWRELLERHNELVRRELTRYRGRELDTAGDGFFASFDGPARAISAGLAVNVGARVAGAAQAGEVLVTSTVKDLVAGSGLTFEDRGERELKGIPERWRLFAVLPS
jgi:pimeloyl-ACP methyl ester carboxylesterase